jgi:hypothetical protein
LIGEPITTGKQPSKSHHRLVKIDDSSIHLKKTVLTLVSRTFSITAGLSTQYACSIWAEITQRLSSNLPSSVFGSCIDMKESQDSVLAMAG